MAQHRAVAIFSEGTRGILAAGVNELRPPGDGLAFGGERLSSRIQHRWRGVDDGDVVATPCQRDALVAGHAAHVNDPQGRRGDVGGEMPVDYVGADPPPQRPVVAADEAVDKWRHASSELMFAMPPSCPAVRYFEIDDWFEAELANPSFYEDRNTIGAVTWFKRAASAEMLMRLTPLCDILDRYGVPWVTAETSDPGTVIYEDELQVGVIPHQRFEPTPMPPGVVLGPTTAASKRHPPAAEVLSRHQVLRQRCPSGI